MVRAMRAGCWWSGLLVQSAVGAMVHQQPGTASHLFVAGHPHRPLRTASPIMGKVDAFPYTGSVRPGKRSPRRQVPGSIVVPDYAADGRPKAKGPMLPWQVEVKTAKDIEGMRVAGRVAREVLDLAGAMVAPGVTTDAIDALVHDESVKRGAYPSPLNCASPRLTATRAVSALVAVSERATSSRARLPSPRRCSPEASKRTAGEPHWRQFHEARARACARSRRRPRLSQVLLHLGERDHLPRHPRLVGAARRRSDQHRRDVLHRWVPRRLLGDLPRRRRRRRRPPARPGHPRLLEGSDRLLPARPALLWDR